MIKQRQSSRKRSFDQVEDSVVEEEAHVAAGSKDRVEEETTIRTEIRAPRGPPTKKRLSAIDEESDRDEQLPMEGVSFLSSPATSPPRPPVAEPARTHPLPASVGEEPDLLMDDESASPPSLEPQLQPLEPQPALEPRPLEPSPADHHRDELDDLFGDELQPPKAGASNGSALTHFLSSRGKAFETRQAPPSPPPPQPQASLPSYLRGQTEDPKEAAAPAIVEDKTTSPPNLPEFELAWVAGGVEPGAHGKASPPVLHVVSGQRLLQNRSGECSFLFFTFLTVSPPI